MTRFRTRLLCLARTRGGRKARVVVPSSASSRPIFHITSAAEAERAQREGSYLPARFDEDGFIHCSYADQVVGVANFLYAGFDDLVLLEIDRSLVGFDVIDENLDGGAKLFPHIYGPLRMAAVRQVHAFPRDLRGVFTLPDAIRHNSR
jgi:uncharacterized protein (DUF952 family)